MLLVTSDNNGISITEFDNYNIFIDTINILPNYPRPPYFLGKLQ
jgi:hypothetical protein